MIKDGNTTNWIWGKKNILLCNGNNIFLFFDVQIVFCFFKHLVFKLGRYQNILNGTQPSTTPTALQPYRRMLMALGWA